MKNFIVMTHTELAKMLASNSILPRTMYLNIFENLWWGLRDRVVIDDINYLLDDHFDSAKEK